MALFGTITKRTAAALRKLANPVDAKAADQKAAAVDFSSVPHLFDSGKPKVEKPYRIFIHGEVRGVSREEYLRYVEQANERTWHWINW